MVFKGAMSKLTGRKRPLDAAEKAINTTKKKIKGPDVRTAKCLLASHTVGCRL